MKRIYSVLFFIFISMAVYAQNIQLHYDLGKDRQYLTSTVEMFRPDKLGNTFFFIDMNYGEGDVKGVSLAYWEIARCFKLGKTPFSMHMEYNGGMGQWKSGTAGGAYQINDAWLGGLDYSWNNADFTKGFSLKALYKYIQGKENVSFQITGVWYLNFFNKKFTMSGFADFWKEEFQFGNNTTSYVFLAEPQFWFNATKNFSVGSEIELSTNFAGNEGFFIAPTAAVKWTF